MVNKQELKRKIDRIGKIYDHINTKKDVKQFINSELKKTPFKFYKNLKIVYVNTLSDIPRYKVSMLSEDLESPARWDERTNEIIFALDPKKIKNTTSISVPLHEIGHAVFDKLPKEKNEAFRKLHKETRDDIKINPFYRFPSETFAEIFAQVYSRRSSLVNHPKLIKFIKEELR